MVHVQAILFASLSILFLSAFVAMLGKQWLTSYDLANVRGSALECGQNRQRKLDGTSTWKFDYVMESLPLMLQAALLLLGGALSRYLWEVNITIASVVLGVASLGVVFYILIIITGTASDSCPYQTPFSRIFRYAPRIFFHHTPRLILRGIPPPLLPFIRISRYFVLFLNLPFQLITSPNFWQLWAHFPLFTVSLMLIFDIVSPLIIAVEILVVVPLTFALLGLLVFFRLFRGAERHSFIGTASRIPSSNQLKTGSDLRCISWILQTSAVKDIQVSAIKRLNQMSGLSHRYPTIITDCFNVFTSCVDVSGDKAVAVQGAEELAEESASGLLCSLCNLIVMDPTSIILLDFKGQYSAVFPSKVDSAGLPFHSTMSEIHTLADVFSDPLYLWRSDYGLTNQEDIPFSRRIAEVAQANRQQTQRRKVPRWTLRTACQYLSLDPRSPASTVADCLVVIAIDMDCNISGITSLDDKRCVHI